MFVAGKSELTVLAERLESELCTHQQAVGQDVNLNEVASVLGDATSKAG